MKTAFRLLALFSLAFATFTVRAVADEVAVARQRISARQSEVAALKTGGAVGENNRGFLEARGGGGNSAAVVSAENSDRAVLYAEVAKRTGGSTDDAGRARAKQIAANSAPGIWVQKDDGSWHKK